MNEAVFAEGYANANESLGTERVEGNAAAKVSDIRVVPGAVQIAG